MKGYEDLLEIVDALELKVIGTFKKTSLAKRFNKHRGDKLQLYPVRTTFTFEQFSDEIFKHGRDGAYLEECVGKGNVKLQITKKTFRAVHAQVRSTSDRNKPTRHSFEGNKERFKGIYKTTCLLSVEEIMELALNPFRIVTIQNYGVVNEGNIKDFLLRSGLVMMEFTENEVTNHVNN